MSGEFLFDFDELEALDATGRKHCLQPGAERTAGALEEAEDASGPPRLRPGESLRGELGRCGPALFCLGVAGRGRGTLTLDVRLVARPEASAAFFVCVGKSGQAPDPWERGFHWLSGLGSGWRCQIRAHRWVYASGDATVLLSLGSEEEPPERPQWGMGYAGSCVAFEALPEAAVVAHGAVTASFEASLAFEAEVDGLSAPELRAAHAAFHDAYRDIDGVEISDAGTQELGRTKDMELTYGEVQLAPFWDLLRVAVAPLSGEAFVDLGSGTGRAVVGAALGFPELRRCWGYEVIPGLHAASEEAAASVARRCPVAPIDFSVADFLGEDCGWEKEADIVWVSSLCMKRDTVMAIQRKAHGLKRGARVVTMSADFGADAESFERVLVDGKPDIRVEMSFADSAVYVVRRT